MFIQDEVEQNTVKLNIRNAIWLNRQKGGITYSIQYNYV